MTVNPAGVGRQQEVLDLLRRDGAYDANTRGTIPPTANQTGTVNTADPYNQPGAAYNNAQGMGNAMQPNSYDPNDPRAQQNYDPNDPRAQRTYDPNNPNAQPYQNTNDQSRQTYDPNNQIIPGRKQSAATDVRSQQPDLPDHPGPRTTLVRSQQPVVSGYK